MLRTLAIAVRIALNGLCGTAIHPIGEILHDTRNNLRFALLQD